MRANESGLNDIWRPAIGGAFAVLNGLGAGFLETAYQHALAHERRWVGRTVERQRVLQSAMTGSSLANMVQIRSSRWS